MGEVVVNGTVIMATRKSVKGVGVRRYVVQKYILAACAADAIKNESREPVDAVYLDDGYEDNFKSTLGFEGA